MKYFIFLTAVSMLILSSCMNESRKDIKSEDVKTRTNLQNNKELSADSVQYNANVDFEMTLSEVAEKNSISLNYLKDELGIPSSLKHDYQLKTISKNFKFTIDDVKKIIADYHRKSGSNLK